MTDQPPPTMPAGWYHDPVGVGDARYWDGTTWTDSISTRGITMTAAIDQEKAHIPPVQGTEFRVVATPPPRPAPTYSPSAPIPTTEPPRRSGGGMLTAIVGVLIAIIVVTILVVILSADDAEGPTNPTDGPPQTQTILTNDPPPPST